MSSHVHLLSSPNILCLRLLFVLGHGQLFHGSVFIWTKYIGPVCGRLLLIIVDTHSKWPEVFKMSTTTSGKSITELQEIFARFRILEKLVSDNGPQFGSKVFESFLHMNTLNTSIHHRTNLPQVVLLRELFKLLNKHCKQAFTTVIQWSTHSPPS